MTEEITQEKPKQIVIQDNLYNYTNQVILAALDGYVTSTGNKYFPRMLTHGVYWCTMVLPEKPVEIVPEEPKEPTPAQIKKEELVAALAEKVNLEEQAGAALVPEEPVKRAGRPAKK
jgi:hypothetical protein